MAAVGRVVVAAIVVAGVIVVGGSAQAVVMADRTSADGQITSPPEGQVVSGASVLVSARTDALQFRMALYVEGPSTSRLIARGDNNQTLSGTFDAGRSPNGTYTVALKGEMAGRVHTTSTFRLRRPAASPSNVKAVLQGAKRIQVTWSKGVEPDLHSYVISATQSGMADRVAAGSACSGSSCRAVLAVPAKAAGRRVGFTVKAFRSDGDGGVVGSGSSGAAYVMVPASKAVQPVKSARPKSEDTTRGSEALPTLPAKKQEKVVATPTRKQTAPASDDKLPAMPDADRQGNLPIPTAETDTGSSDSLTPEGVKPDTEAAPIATHVTAQSAESPLGALGQYGLYIAGGMVLMLLAGFVGAWTRRPPVAAEAAATPLSGGAPGQTNPGGMPFTTTASRRPAIVLAVAKTHSEIQEPRPKATEQVDTAQRSLAAQGSERAASAVHELPAVRGPERASGGQWELPVMWGPERTQAPEKSGGEMPVALPFYKSADDKPTGAQETARQEPVWLTLPSSAVTDVSDSLPSGTQPGVRIDDRWNDYLPSVPRSMEDNEYWNRFKPGADFWAPDDEDDSYVGRRRHDDDT